MYDLWNENDKCPPEIMAQTTLPLTYSPADFDIDQDVDIDDLLIFIAAWGSSSGQPTWNPVCDISVPPDGVIDYKDFGEFAKDWTWGL